MYDWSKNRERQYVIEHLLLWRWKPIYRGGYIAFYYDRASAEGVKNDLDHSTTLGRFRVVEVVRTGVHSYVLSDYFFREDGTVREQYVPKVEDDFPIMTITASSETSRTDPGSPVASSSS
jgi:hypothetical protein